MSYTSSLFSRIERFDEHYKVTHKSDTLLFYTRMFDIFWDSHQYPPLLTKERLSGWICCLDEESVHRQVSRILLVRQLGKYLQSIGERDQYVLPYGICPKVPEYVPYFFTEEELKRFFSDEVMGLLLPVSGAMSRQYVLPQLFSTIHCCGLRPGEARTLLLEDVDLGHEWLDIKGTKTSRDRRLPIGEALLENLRQYDLIMQRRLPGRKYFFPTKIHDCYTSSSLSNSFSSILKDAGIGQSSNGNNAHLYNLRHHYAIENINGWVAEPNFDSKFQYLSKSMGHSSLESTKRYYSLIPEFAEILQETSEASFNEIIPEVDEYED